MNKTKKNKLFSSNETFAELILRKIIEYNGEGSSVYGLTGSGVYQSNMVFQKAVKQGKIVYKHASQESSGVYMAAYEAEVLNKVGINFTTAGPAILTAMQGLINMFSENKPVISIHGDALEANFDYINTKVFDHIVKAHFVITENTINPGVILDDAFYIAKNGTTKDPGPGPVTIIVNEKVWLKKYKYTKLNKFYIKKNISPIIVLNQLYKLFKRDTLVIIRIGARVHKENAHLLAEFTKKYPNFYLHLVNNGDNLINSYDYCNSGIEGPLSNPEVNNNYNIADVVINIGTGIEFSEFEYLDVGPKLKKSTAKIIYVFSEPLNSPPASSNAHNSFTMCVNNFVHYWMDDFDKHNFKFDTKWPNRNMHKFIQDEKILMAYVNQKDKKDKKYLTAMSIIGQTMKVIYDNQNEYEICDSKKIKKYVINDKNVYTADIGLASFVGLSLMHHVNNDNKFGLLQASPIGASTSCLAGRLASGLYEGAVTIMGDGSLMTSPGFLIDLTNAVSISNTRVLYICINDNKYSNVYQEEMNLFNGRSTDITSTYDLQKNIDLYDILKSTMGRKFIKSIQLGDITKPSRELASFVDKWYKKEAGFTEPGYYVIYYETFNGLPYPYKHVNF